MNLPDERERVGMCACASQMAKRHEKKRGGSAGGGDGSANKLMTAGTYGSSGATKNGKGRCGNERMVALVRAAAIYERDQHACAGYTTTRGHACAAQGAHDAATSPARSLLLETHTPCYQPHEQRN